MTLFAKELRTKTREELLGLLKKTQGEIRKVSESTLGGEEKNLGKSRRMRKELARIKTVLKGQVEEEHHA